MFHHFCVFLLSRIQFDVWPKVRWSKMKRMVRVWHSGTGKAVVENLQVEKFGDLYA